MGAFIACDTFSKSGVSVFGLPVLQMLEIPQSSARTPSDLWSTYCATGRHCELWSLRE